MLERTTKKAIVLAAGFGTRLRPFTASVPKPLLPVWGEPMLARVVDMLREWGVEDIVVNCHHLSGQIEEWCAANGCRAAVESEILGTGGVLNPLRDWIGGEDFYLVNGDIVVEGVERPPAPDPAKGEIAVALVTEEGPRTIEVEPESGFVTCWKSPDPGWQGTYTYCGIAHLSAQILRFVKGEGFSTIVEAYEKAMMEGLFTRAMKVDGMFWTDAGTLDAYLELNSDGAENAYGKIPQIASALKAMGADAGAAVEFTGARGSDRAFFKAAGAYIIVYDDSKRAENAKYASHARWLAAHGISVPAVLADLPHLKTLALENAGSEDLLARSARRGEDRLYDYVAVVEALAKFNALESGHCEGREELEAPFDSALYKWERDLFREYCLGARFHMEMPAAVEKELESVAARLEKEPPALVHRDFQSTNIVWSGKVGGGKDEARDFKFIDFQGMRRGPAAYDLASLLYDPYVTLREGERRALAALYAKKSGRADIAEVLPLAAVERLVQALGAYGRLESVGKSGFARHVLPALENLLAAADEAGLDAIGALAEDLIAKESERAKKKHAQGHHHGEGCDCGHHHHHDHDCTCTEEKP